MSKTICVLGNEGKTILSYYLANALSTNGKRCAIISTNCTEPNINMVTNDSKSTEKSLGRLLSLAVITPQAIAENMVSLANKNIAVLCYARGESNKSYPQILQSNLEILFKLLSSLVDYIIVDTQTSRNVIDEYAVQHSDNCICITTADMKGIAYRQVILDEINVVHVLYNNSPFNPLEDVKNTYKTHIKYILPNCKELHYVYNGALLDDVINCPKAYRKVLDKVVKEILEHE